MKKVTPQTAAAALELLSEKELRELLRRYRRVIHLLVEASDARARSEKIVSEAIAVLVGE